LKVCKKCGGSEFYKDGRCKPCRRANTARYRKANPEKSKECCAKYREKNRDNAKECSAKWRTDHPSHLKEYCKQWRQYNPDRRRGRYAKNPQVGLRAATKWNAANPEKVTARNAKRRAKKLQAIPKWFSELDELIIQEAHALAKQRTQLTGFKWHVDHEVPLQSKLVCGFHIGCNIQVIPASINISKGNRHWTNMP
jgi:hypothetical protein